jgi:hypothetical protein
MNPQTSPRLTGPTPELRQLAGGMPHRSEGSQRELTDWLVKHRPRSIDNL